MRTLSLKQKAKIAWMVFLHRRTPFAAKATIIIGVLYGLLPFDLIPDILPILGMVDDATLLVLSVMIFLHLTKTLRKEFEKRPEIIDIDPN